MTYARARATALALLLVASMAGCGQNADDTQAPQTQESKLVVSFKAIAEQLIVRHKAFGLSDEEATILRRALSQSSIVSTPALVNPVTGKPLQCSDGPHLCPEKLIAYGSPGLIQLKEDSGRPQEDSWERVLNERRPFAHYVAHELFRASGVLGSDGRSIDDTFQISVQRCHLDTNEATLALLDFVPDQHSELNQRFKPSGMHSLVEKAQDLEHRLENGKIPAFTSGSEVRNCLLYDSPTRDFTYREALAKQVEFIVSENAQLSQVKVDGSTFAPFQPSPEGHTIEGNDSKVFGPEYTQTILQISEDVAGDLILRETWMTDGKRANLKQDATRYIYCPSASHEKNLH